MALITCENVSIGYEGQTVVKELNFSIERGDYLCIVGENGSGKSTLVKSLLGLKGADRGKIIYGDGLKKNEIGYLPQKNEEQKGAFIQGSYRSSAAILGLAFINNMYDSVGMAPLMIIGCVPLYNIFAVIILTLKGDNGGKKPNMKETFINVMKNPILLSILIALPFALLNLHFPSFVNKAIGSVANTATPLALISIGASFEGKKALKKMKPTLLASFIKLILLVGLFIPLAVFFGYRNQELMALLVMLGSPTTVSSYIMAKNTGNDGILTSSIIVLTTLLSSLTLTLWIFVLKSFGVL